MMQFIRNFNQVALFILVIVFIFEFINHEASWDGIYKAHIKHMRRAETQIFMGE